MRPPDWMYLPHLGCGGGSDFRDQGGEARLGDRGPAEPVCHGADEAELTTLATSAPPVYARSSTSDAAACRAEAAPISGRDPALGSEETRGGCGGATDVSSGGIRGRRWAPGRVRGGTTEGLAEQRDDGALDKPGSRVDETDKSQKTGMAWYFADIAETAAKRKRERGDEQRPSAAERMQALRRRLAVRVAAVEPTRGASTNEKTDEVGNDVNRPNMTGASVAAARVVAWHSNEQGGGSSRRELRAQPQSCASPSESSA